MRPEPGANTSALRELAATTGRAPDQLVEDALAGYLEELVAIREILESRHDDLKSGRVKSGRVKPIDGEEAFRRLRDKSAQRRSGACAVTPSISKRSPTLTRSGNTSPKTITFICRRMR